MAVPRYFGSLYNLDDIISALLVQDPSLGQSKAEQEPAYCSGNPLDGRPAETNTDPMPWFGASVESAVSLIVSELSLRQIGQKMPESPMKKEVIARVDASIAEFLDDYCGTGPYVARTSWPGPPPWILPTVNQLSSVASTMQDKELRESVLDVAATMAQKSFAYAARG